MNKRQHGYITEPTEANRGYAGLSEATRRESPAPMGAFARRDPSTSMPFSGQYTVQPRQQAPSPGPSNYDPRSEGDGAWNTGAKAKLRNGSMSAGTFSGPSPASRPSTPSPASSGGTFGSTPSLGGFASQLTMGGTTPSTSGEAISRMGGGAAGDSPAASARTPRRSGPRVAAINTRTATASGAVSSPAQGPSPGTSPTRLMTRADDPSEPEAVAPRGGFPDPVDATTSSSSRGGFPGGRAAPPARSGNLFSRAVMAAAEHPVLTGGALAAGGVLTRSPRLVQAGLAMAGGSVASDVAGSATRAFGGDDQDELAARVVGGAVGGWFGATRGPRLATRVAQAGTETAGAVRQAMVPASSTGVQTPPTISNPSRIAVGSAAMSDGASWRPRSAPRASAPAADTRTPTMPPPAPVASAPQASAPPPRVRTSTNPAIPASQPAVRGAEERFAPEAGMNTRIRPSVETPSSPTPPAARRPRSQGSGGVQAPEPVASPRVEPAVQAPPPAAAPSAPVPRAPLPQALDPMQVRQPARSAGGGVTEVPAGPTPRTPRNTRINRPEVPSPAAPATPSPAPAVEAPPPVNPVMAAAPPSRPAGRQAGTKRAARAPAADTEAPGASPPVASGGGITQVGQGVFRVRGSSGPAVAPSVEPPSVPADRMEALRASARRAGVPVRSRPSRTPEQPSVPEFEDDTTISGTHTPQELSWGAAEDITSAGRRFNVRVPRTR